MFKLSNKSDDKEEGFDSSCTMSAGLDIFFK